MEAIKKLGRLALAGVIFSHKVVVAFCEEYPSATAWTLYAMVFGLAIMGLM